MRINHQAPLEQKDRAELTRDTLLTQLKGLTPDQAAQWIEANVTDLPSAKVALKVMAKVIVFLLRNSFS
jgi:hypothetical protein